MANIMDLLSLLINVFGLTGGFKRRASQYSYPGLKE